MEKFKTPATAIATAAILGVSACSAEDTPSSNETVIDSNDPVTSELGKTLPDLESIKQTDDQQQLVERLLATGRYERKSHEHFGDYIIGNLGNPEIAARQEQYVLGAMEWLLANGPYGVQVDEEVQTVTFHQPEAETPRIISSVPELKDISLVVPGDVSKGPRTHQTYQLIDGEPRLYSAIAGVHQNLEDGRYSGPFGGAAIEWCHMLDMRLEGFSIKEDSELSHFLATKEGMCNTLGAAVNVITAGEDYSFYEQLVEGRYLGEPAAHEHEVLYPKLSREEFETLSSYVLSDE